MRHSSLICKAHVGGVGGVGHPLGGSSGCGLLQHAVDLFQGKSLGFGDQEVGVDEADGAETAPDVEDLGAQVAFVLVHHVRGDDGDDAVPQPVAGGREGDTTSTHGQRVDFADDNPSSRTPRASKEEDVDADKGNHTLDGGIRARDRADNSNDELADNHSQSAPDEQRSAANPLHRPE